MITITLTSEQAHIALLAITREIDVMRPTYSRKNADEHLSRWISTQNLFLDALQDDR